MFCLKLFKVWRCLGPCWIGIGLHLFHNHSSITVIRSTGKRDDALQVENHQIGSTGHCNDNAGEGLPTWDMVDTPQ